MLSEPIALPILDTADVLTAAYEQLTRFRAYVEAAREITRGSSTPRPAGSAAHALAAPLSLDAALAHAVGALAPAAGSPDGAPPTSTLFFLSSPSPFSERHLFLPIPLHLRLTPLSLTLHATLPIFYAERPLLGIDSRSLVILTRDLPSRHRPPSPCAFATVHLPVDIDQSRCTAAFHHGSLGIRMLRAHPHSTAPSPSAPSSPARAASLTTK